jgi:hypothetical protein
MQAESIGRIESGFDRVASTLFALACAYAAFSLLAARLPLPALFAETVTAWGLAYLVCLRVLRAIHPKMHRVQVPIFDLREIDPIDSPVLLLTDLLEQEYGPNGGAEDVVTVEAAEVKSVKDRIDTDEEPLLLDDILAELGPDSRVVRLFDSAAMPTAGELKTRIDRHLDREASPSRSYDAAQELHDALAKLRRSIR